MRKDLGRGLLKWKKGPSTGPLSLPASSKRGRLCVFEHGSHRLSAGVPVIRAENDHVHGPKNSTFPFPKIDSFLETSKAQVSVVTQRLCDLEYASRLHPLQSHCPASCLGLREYTKFSNPEF